jgi:hypothetical protein
MEEVPNNIGKGRRAHKQNSNFAHFSPAAEYAQVRCDKTAQPRPCASIEFR